MDLRRSQRFSFESYATFLHKGALVLPRECPVNRSHFTKQFQLHPPLFLLLSRGDRSQAMLALSNTAGRLWPCLGMHLCISSSPICQAALGKVAPAHLFLYMAPRRQLSSLQHTFETEIALCFYTHTHIFHFNFSYKTWEYRGIYLRAPSNISVISHLQQQLKTGFPVMPVWNRRNR